MDHLYSPSWSLNTSQLKNRHSAWPTDFQNPICETQNLWGQAHQKLKNAIIIRYSTWLKGRLSAYLRYAREWTVRDVEITELVHNFSSLRPLSPSTSGKWYEQIYHYEGRKSASSIRQRDVFRDLEGGCVVDRFYELRLRSRSTMIRSVEDWCFEDEHKWCEILKGVNVKAWDWEIII